MKRKKLFFLIGILLAALYCLLWLLWENEAMICNAKYGIGYEITAVARTNVHCKITTEKLSLKIRMIPNVLEKRTILGWYELKGTGNLEEKFEHEEYSMLEKGEPFTFGINFGDFYGKLTNGTYRFKFVVCNDEKEDLGYCYITFKIQ